MTDDDPVKSPHLPSWEWLEQLSHVDGQQLCVRMDGADRIREFMVEVEEVDRERTLDEVVEDQQPDHPRLDEEVEAEAERLIEEMTED